VIKKKILVIVNNNLERGSRFMASVTVNGTKFSLLSWDFCEDGCMGGIYFLVPHNTYQYDSNNGASVCKDNEHPGYDRARAACPCFDVDDVHEDDFMELPLEDIIKAAAEFIDLNMYRVK
jgi:hypothetical protein